MLELGWGGGWSSQLIWDKRGDRPKKKNSYEEGRGVTDILRQILSPPPLLPQLKMNGSLAEEIRIGNSTICSFPSEMDAPLCIGAHQQHDNIWQKEVNAIKT